MRLFDRPHQADGPGPERSGRRGRHRRGGPDAGPSGSSGGDPPRHAPRRREIPYGSPPGTPRRGDPAREPDGPYRAATDAGPHRVSWRDFELDDELPRARPHPPDAGRVPDGRRHCGNLESVLYRQWDERTEVPPEVVRAVDSLAELPQSLKDRLADGLDGIYVGPGGVPELDDMRHLRGVPLPSGGATWDVCAGAYGDRKIVVGDRPSPTPDVMFHEIGHALDDVDGPPGDWQSDGPEFRALYERCLPKFVSDFHRQPDGIGRREFFADAFAAIASRQRPALLDMLGGDARTALNVMLFFNRRYGI